MFEGIALMITHVSMGCGKLVRYLIKIGSPPGIRIPLYRSRKLIAGIRIYICTCRAISRAV